MGEHRQKRQMSTVGPGTNRHDFECCVRKCGLTCILSELDNWHANCRVDLPLFFVEFPVGTRSLVRLWAKLCHFNCNKNQRWRTMNETKPVLLKWTGSPNSRVKFESRDFSSTSIDKVVKKRSASICYVEVDSERSIESGKMQTVTIPLKSTLSAGTPSAAWHCRSV